MTLAENIIRLMVDGRERTVNDVHVRIKGDVNVLRKALVRLAQRGYLASNPVSFGNQKMVVYRIAGREAAE
jgi:hypothetical protein